jgi:hypothetical protein
MEKNTQKVQALISEPEYIAIQRIMFWDQVNGKKYRGLSGWLRNLIQEEIERRPEEDKQSIRNAKK